LIISNGTGTNPVRRCRAPRNSRSGAKVHLRIAMVDWKASRMGKASFLVVALLLMALPSPASSAIPGAARWAAPEKIPGMAQLVRVRRAAHRQHRRALHTRERAVKADELERARSDKTEETPRQQSPDVRRSPKVEPGTPPGEPRAPQEKLALPHPLSKQSPTPSGVPPEVGKPDPEAPRTNEPPPQPPAWSDAEVIGALRRCVSDLAPTGALVQSLEPIRNGQCGTPAPVRLRGFMLPIDMEVNPPAVVNCNIVTKLHDWIRDSLQPAAERALRSRITRIITVSSYDCRNRIGSTNTRISEHAYANAIDISAVVTADGRTIDVLTNWGPTARDLQKRSASADDGQAEAKAKATKGERGRTPSRKEASGRRRSDERKTMTDVPVISEPRTPEAAFLRDVHAGACRIFGTVLGPEANEAHRNHLHLDLARRRRSAFCE
jgi:hypothetical protein